MADGDQTDPSQKTEEPTEKRKEEARKEGQIATSKELSAWIVMVAGAIVLFVIGPALFNEIKGVLTHYISAPHDFSMGPQDLLAMSKDLLLILVKLFVVPAALLVGFALIAGLIQSGGNLSGKSLQPKLEKISLFKGAKRMLSVKGVLEMIKGVLKIAICVLIWIVVVWPLVKSANSMLYVPVTSILTVVYDISLKLFLGVLSVMMVLVAIDYIYQKMSMLKQLRMSKQDVKEEHKQMEGDPHVKQKLKQIRMERARTRMMAEVPNASVVIANPTHFAVALRYESASMDAPLVVAKGQDHLALKIKEIAKENKVSVVENPPLARSLFDAVEVDEEIPIAYYEAVADVIRHVMKTERKKF